MSAATAAHQVTLHSLGPLTDIPVGEGRAYAVDGTQVAVFRLRDGQVRALQAACPHKGGPLADGQLDLRVVMCPLHANSFDLETGCSTTGEVPARTYDVRVDDDGHVVLALLADEPPLPVGPPSRLAESIPTGAPNPGPTEVPLDTAGAR